MSITDKIRKINKLAMRSYCLIGFLLVALQGFSIKGFAQETLNDNQYKKQNQARKSDELYVHPGFNFETFQPLMLDLFVTNSDGVPLEGIMLKVSFISTDVKDIEDPRAAEGSLLNIAKTDAYGRVFQKMEVSNSVEKVLLELNANARENKVIVVLDDTNQLSHTFVVD